MRYLSSVTSESAPRKNASHSSTDATRPPGGRRRVQCVCAEAIPLASGPDCRALIRSPDGRAPQSRAGSRPVQKQRTPSGSFSKVRMATVAWLGFFPVYRGMVAGRCRPEGTYRSTDRKRNPPRLRFPRHAKHAHRQNTRQASRWLIAAFRAGGEGLHGRRHRKRVQRMRRDDRAVRKSVLRSRNGRRRVPLSSRLSRDVGAFQASYVTDYWTSRSLLPRILLTPFPVWWWRLKHCGMRSRS